MTTLYLSTPLPARDDAEREELRDMLRRPESSDAYLFVSQRIDMAKTFGETPRIDRYVLEKVLGRGGMGVVVRARDCEYDVAVALKVLAGRLDPDAIPEPARAAWLQHAHQEALRLMRIRGDRVVRVFGVGITEGFRWLAMQYLEGVDLQRRFREPGARLPWQSIVCWFVDAAIGLQSVHDEALVHRDVKPHNILIDTEDRRACLIDLGLAMAVTTALPEATGPGVRLSSEAATTPPLRRGYTRPNARRDSCVYVTRAAQRASPRPPQ